jgi:hypothetical protein
VWSFQIVVGEPIHEPHLEVLVTGKAILVPKIIIDYFPKSFDLSIGLRTSDLGVLMDDSELGEYSLKTMIGISCTRLVSIMRSELKSVV